MLVLLFLAAVAGAAEFELGGPDYSKTLLIELPQGTKILSASELHLSADGSSIAYRVSLKRAPDAKSALDCRPSIRMRQDMTEGGAADRPTLEHHVKETRRWTAGRGEWVERIDERRRTLYLWEKGLCAEASIVIRHYTDDKAPLLNAAARFVPTRPLPPGMAKFKEGLRLHNARRYAEAAAAYKEAVSNPEGLDDSKIAWAYRSLGSVAVELNDAATAEQALKKSVELEQNSGAHLELARVYAMQGRLDHAESELRLSLVLAAKQANALHERTTEEARSDPKLAALRERPSFEKLFKVTRPHPLIKDKLLKADRLRSGGANAQAVLAYTQIISASAGLSDAELASAYHGLGKAALALDDAKKAAPALEKALELAGRPNPDLHFDLACAYAMRGELQSAQQQLRQCFEAEDSKRGHAMIYLAKARTEPRLAVIRRQPLYDKFIAWWSLPQRARREAEKRAARE